MKICGLDTKSAQMPDRRPTTEWRAWRVLLVEDNPVAREAVASRLEAQGCNVVTARDGKEAIDAFEQAAFDVVLMDVQMPNVDGIAAARVMRSREKTTGARVPIIALTAHVENSEREQCQAAGMDAYVSKPVRTTSLLGTIHKVLSDSGHCWPGESDAAANRPMIDPPSLLELVDGDHELLARMIGLFRVEYPRLLTELRRSLDEGDLQSVQSVAHAIEGMISNFGPEAVARIGEPLEAVKQLCKDGVATSLQKLDESLRHLDQELLAAGEGG